MFSKDRKGSVEFMNFEKVLIGDKECEKVRKIEFKCVIGLKWLWFLVYGNEFCDSYVVDNKCLKIERNELLKMELFY